MRERKQPFPGGRRRVTDRQIYLLQTWMPFTQLARKLGISPSYAKKLRNDEISHKNPSP